MVQTRRNEQAVGHAVDARTRSTEALDGGTEVEERVVNEGPYEVEDGGNHDGEKRSEDGDEAAAREEGQEVRQLSAMEAVIDHRRHDACKDAEKNVAVTDCIPTFSRPFDGFVARKSLGIFDAAIAGHRVGAQELHEGGIRQETGQCGGTIGVFGQAKGDGYGEDPAQVIQHGTTGADEQLRDHVILAGNAGYPVANAAEDRRDRQYCHGAHQRLSEPLQRPHNIEFHERSPFKGVKR